MDWQPISDAEFKELFSGEYLQLSEDERRAFEKVRVPFSKATVRRSDAYGDEDVFVVARTRLVVLYYDDVEGGFASSPVDQTNKLLNPSGNVGSLRDAILDLGVGIKVTATKKGRIKVTATKIDKLRYIW
jgi:hypothetical protein